MSDKKYQVFVSSTFQDLEEERRDAIRSILDLGHIPAGMELFPAADIDQLDHIKKVIDVCDYYLLIIGGRYGSKDATGVSYTEREYDYAVDTKKFIIAFIHTNLDAIPRGKSELNPKDIEALEAFRKKVKGGRLVKTWNDGQQLRLLITTSLAIAFNENPQVGWIRGDSAATDVLLEQSNKAMQENAALKEKLEKLQAQLAEHKIENLAGLDDIFKIRCEYRVRGYGGKTTNFDRDVQATWREIFIHVAGQLDLPRVASYIDNGIKQLVVEKDPGTEIQSINSTDRITIKIQLEALGLISTSVMNAVDGRMHEYLSLTPAGRLQFLQERSVKKT